MEGRLLPWGAWRLFPRDGDKQRSYSVSVRTGSGSVGAGQGNVPGRWKTTSKILFKAGKGEVPGDKGKQSELREGGIKPGFRFSPGWTV